MPSHRIQVGDVTLACEDRGSGMPVVLVHGFPLDHRMWDAQIESLASEFRVIAPDLRGFGASTIEPADAERGVGMEEYAQDVLALLAELGVAESVVLAGFSMGGYVAWQLALRQPQRVRGLVQCDTRAAGDAEEAIAARQKMAQAVMAEGNARPALAMIARLLSPETQEQRPEIVAAVEAMIERQSAEGIAAAQRGMARREDVRDDLYKIACPCLAIVGLADVISPPAEVHEFVKGLPDVRVAEIAGGHLTPMENADAVTAAIREFAQARSAEA